MYAQNSPPITDSIRLLTENRISLGSSIILHHIASGPTPPHALAAWIDGPDVFYLTANPDPIPATLPLPGEDAGSKIHENISSSAVYQLGDSTVCKVKSWAPGMQLEAATIAYVRRTFPSALVPVPEVVHSWVDGAWNRTFLVERQAPGTRLEEAWANMSEKHLQDVASRVGFAVREMARAESDRVASCDGRGLSEQFLLGGLDPRTDPTWRPKIKGPFTARALAAHMGRCSSARIPRFGPPFAFYHNDLGPRNIFVELPLRADGTVDPRGDASVSCIVDWEAAGYYPREWIGTMPMLGSGFMRIRGATDVENTAWIRRLAGVLDGLGFGNMVMWATEYIAGYKDNFKGEWGY